MLKLIGAAAVVCATTCLGFSKAGMLEKRIKYICKTVRMLNEVKIILNYSLSTTDEVIAKLKENSDFSELIANENNIPCLTHEENRLIADFWKQLGSTDLESQLSSIEMFIKQFEEDLCSLKEMRENKCRLYRTLGILSGLFICVILI